MKKKKVPKSIRDWMAKNGRKGGKAGKGSPARIAANKRTAQNRWRKLHPAPVELQDADPHRCDGTPRDAYGD